MENVIQSEVVAVIVTYNRCELLKKCLKAILNQDIALKAIVVIDNASTDDTQKQMIELSLTEDRLFYQRLHKNGGGSLGFHEGMKTAQRFNPSWLWIMDDDTIASPSALRILLDSPQCMDPSTGYICSRVNSEDGSPCGMNITPLKWEWPYSYTPGSDIFMVQNCSFVSVLIKNSAIDIVGLPVKDFFIWWDDVEYTLRLSEIYKGFLNYNSIVTHMTANCISGDMSLIDSSNLWKYKYGIRNQMALFGRNNGITGFLKGLYGVLKMSKILIKSKKSLKIILSMFFSALNGLFLFNYRKRIEFFPAEKSGGENQLL